MLLTPLPSPSEERSGLTHQPTHRVLVVGGSYAGLGCVLSLLDHLDGRPATQAVPQLPKFPGRKLKGRVEITLLDERDGFFHTVGAPLAHVSQRHVEHFWKTYSSLTQLQHPALRVLRGRLTRFDPENLVASYEGLDASPELHHVGYDYLVLATGLARSWPIVPSAHSKAIYVSEATVQIDKLASSHHVAVVGGGAVGIEIAAELKHNHPAVKVTLIHSRQELLSNEPLPLEFKFKTLELLQEEGIEVILDERAGGICPAMGDCHGQARLRMSNGSILEADSVIDATARCPPNTKFAPQQMLTSEGLFDVTQALVVSADATSRPRHFAAGDIAAVRGIKRAGAAIVMGQITAENIWALINTNNSDATFELAQYPIVAPAMALAIGDKAVGYSGADLNGNAGHVAFGKDLKDRFFGDDLGWATCLRFMGLSGGL